MLRTNHKGFILFNSVNISEVHVTGFKLRYLESRYLSVVTELRPAPQVFDRLYSPTSLLPGGYRCCFLGGREIGAWR
jgi:hypothetical protein